MKQLKVTSDVKNRLKKVREGIVYNDIYAVVDEVVVQNPKRAGSTKVYITLKDDQLTISDNGKGCPRPETLFTLDFSGFGNGFGEGFTSVYMLADSFHVRTLDWEGFLDVKQVLDDKKGELDVTISPLVERMDGFELTLKGEKVRYYAEDLITYIYEATAIVPDMDFVVNGWRVDKKNIFDVEATSDFVSYVSNRKFEGFLSLCDDYYQSEIKIYFEHRFVMDLRFNGMSGSILLKPNAVNLRTPDRRSIIFDEKEHEFKKLLRKEAKKLLLEVVKSGDSDSMKDFAEYVSSYMTVEEYMPYLMIESSTILNQYETREMKQELEVYMEDSKQQWEEDVVLNNDEHSDLEDVSISTESPASVLSVNMADSFALLDNSFIASVEKVSTADSSVVLTVQKNNFTKSDTKRIEDDIKMTSLIVDNKKAFIEKKDMDTVSIRNIKSKKNIVWVQKENVEEYTSLISKYEYYGVFTFVSPHVLFDNALYHLEIPHINTLETDAMQKKYKVTKVGARTKKEERVLELLGFIESVLGIGETFNIASIDCKLIVQLRGTKIYQEKLNVEGYAQGTKINLNRKDLDFGTISSVQLGKNSFGLNDLKFILANLDIIAHELAHIMYETEDNTKNHFEKQISIQNKIAKAIMENEKLW